MKISKFISDVLNEIYEPIVENLQDKFTKVKCEKCCCYIPTYLYKNKFHTCSTEMKE